jgi:hypothetical protein
MGRQSAKVRPRHIIDRDHDLVGQQSCFHQRCVLLDLSLIGWVQHSSSDAGTKGGVDPGVHLDNFLTRLH